jgi:pimeloyl-ACP methyl ester carboxylesterase
MVAIELPQELRGTSRYFNFPLEIKKNKTQQQKMHYFVKGEGENVVCVHGNPTWSYYFHPIIHKLSSKYKVYSVDHLGCGLSTRPEGVDFDLKLHAQNFARFMESEIKEEKITLIVHDWGGPIGLSWAVQNPHRIQRLIVSNTAGFLSKSIPFRILALKLPILGELIIRGLNGFCLPAAYMAPHFPLTEKVKNNLLAPYQTFKDRKAVSDFVKDIPLHPLHPTYNFLAEIEAGLKKIKCPKLLIWGMKDFCFHKGYFKTWQKIYPEASVLAFPLGGHYLFLDYPEETSQSIYSFLEEHP